MQRVAELVPQAEMDTHHVPFDHLPPVRTSDGRMVIGCHQKSAGLARGYVGAHNAHATGASRSRDHIGSSVGSLPGYAPIQSGVPCRRFILSGPFLSSWSAPIFFFLLSTTWVHVGTSRRRNSWPLEPCPLERFTFPVPSFLYFSHQRHSYDREHCCSCNSVRQLRLCMSPCKQQCCQEDHQCTLDDGPIIIIRSLRLSSGQSLDLWTSVICSSTTHPPCQSAEGTS